MKITEKNNLTFVHMPPNTGVQEFEQIQKGVLEYIDERPVKVVMNMENVYDYNSVLIKMIIQLYKEITLNEGQLYLTGVGDRLKKSLAAANLNKIIPLYPKGLEINVEEDLKKHFKKE